MKNTFIVTSLSASAFLLSSFTSFSPYLSTGELAPYAAKDRVQEYEIQVERGNDSSEASPLTYEILLKTLQDSFDTLTDLLNECNANNADSQAEKIKEEVEGMVFVRALVRKLHEIPEARNDVDEDEWRAKLNASRKNVIQAATNVYLQKLYGSDALRNAVMYLLTQLKK